MRHPALYIGVRTAGERRRMWPRRTTMPFKSAAMTEARPLLATAPADGDEPLLAGCGKKIGVKPESMGYVVVEAPKKTAASRAACQWSAVASNLVAGLLGRPDTRRTPQPDR